VILDSWFGIPTCLMNILKGESGLTHTWTCLHWVEHYIFSNAIHTDMLNTLLGLGDLQVTMDSSWPYYVSLSDSRCDMNTRVLYTVEIGHR
jgi:hypothetical protein